MGTRPGVGVGETGDAKEAVTEEGVVVTEVGVEVVVAVVAAGKRERWHRIATHSWGEKHFQGTKVLQPI